MSEEEKDLLEDEEELDLSSLSDEDLVLQMHDDPVSYTHLTLPTIYSV